MGSSRVDAGLGFARADQARRWPPVHPTTEGALVMHAQRMVLRSLASGMFSLLVLGLYPTPSRGQWIQSNGPRGGLVRAFATIPDGTGGANVYAGQFHVWRTEDDGASWTHLTTGLSDPNAFALTAVPDGSGGNDLLVGTNTG